MKFFHVILYDRDGYEIDSREIEGKANAKRIAKHMLSDEYARLSETTHATLKTMKVSVFNEGDKTGANAVCEWDAFHPQHAIWEAKQKRLEEERETYARVAEAADEHTESEKEEFLRRPNA